MTPSPQQAGEQRVGRSVHYPRHIPALDSLLRAVTCTSGDSLPSGSEESRAPATSSCSGPPRGNSPSQVTSSHQPHGQGTPRSPSRLHPLGRSGPVVHGVTLDLLRGWGWNQGEQFKLTRIPLQGGVSSAPTPPERLRPPAAPRTAPLPDPLWVPCHPSLPSARASGRTHPSP